jgi:hypothetical protein
MSPAFHPPNLKNRVALVAGATRGVGRGRVLHGAQHQGKPPAKKPFQENVAV